MVALCIASMEPGAGKSLLCAGLGAYYRERGLRVGYFRPWYGEDPTLLRQAREEAAFFRQIFALPQSEMELLGVALSAAHPSLPGEAKAQLRERFRAASEGRELMLLELATLPNGPTLSLLTETADLLGAGVILVLRYHGGVTVERVAAYALALGPRLLGVIVNAVRAEERYLVRTHLVRPLGEQKITVLGLLPLERQLLAPTVAELARGLEGTILNAPEQGEEAVEYLLAGSRSFDPAGPYLARRSNQGIICRGDLPDFLLHAMEPNVRCLLITGAEDPSYAVRYRAEEEEIPIVRVPLDTARALERLDALLSEARFHHPARLPWAVALLRAGLDLDALDRALGLAQAGGTRA